MQINSLIINVHVIKHGKLHIHRKKKNMKDQEDLGRTDVSGAWVLREENLSSTSISKHCVSV